MDLSKLKVSEIYDVAILRHGFHANNRDYVFEIETNWVDENAGRYLLTFKNCSELKYKAIVDDFEKFDWSSNWSMAYPGFSEFPESELSKIWSDKLKFNMIEYSLETEIFEMSFLASSFRLIKISDDTSLLDKAVFRLE